MLRDRALEKKLIVLQTLASIRSGELCSYAELARRSGYPGSARHIARLLHNCPDHLPWWRIIRADQRLGLNEHSSEGRLQCERLQQEGWHLHCGKLIHD
ncbi:MAG: MGMT family protein [Pseudomonadales bacterium]|nr:MGMT family protein [Pseudomonadales bacterium]